MKRQLIIMNWFEIFELILLHALKPLNFDFFLDEILLNPLISKNIISIFLNNSFRPVTIIQIIIVKQ